MELSRRIQELQNEVHCMSESRDFQDAESIRSENSHVACRPVSFTPHPIPEGMQSRSIGMPSRREGPPSIWEHLENRETVIISTLSSRIESMEFIDRGAASYVYSGET